MLKLEFTNAVVSDIGFGVHINGRALNSIISTALGTKVANNYGTNAGLKEFHSNACNVTVIIDPQPVTTHIEDDEFLYKSVEDLEGDKREQFKKEIAETDPEE